MRTRAKDYGIVVWDPSVPATSNLATTVCGADGTKETVDAAHLFADGTNDAAEPLREEYRYASAIRPDRYASEADYRAALGEEERP